MYKVGNVPWNKNKKSKGMTNKKSFGKGHIPWNKGIKVEYHPWNKGKKTGIVPSTTFQKGHKLFVGNKHALGHKHSIETIKKLSGQNNPMWIEDRTKLKKSEKRNSSAYLEWVLKCKKRDKFKCKIDNCDCRGHLEVHHILSFAKFPELRYNINNGITLCQFHHPKKREEEKRLIPFFQSMVEVKSI